MPMRMRMPHGNLMSAAASPRWAEPRRVRDATVRRRRAYSCADFVVYEPLTNFQLPATARIYRLTHPLGQYVLETGRNLQAPAQSLTFHYGSHKPRISMVERLVGPPRGSAT